MVNTWELIETDYKSDCIVRTILGYLFTYFKEKEEILQQQYLGHLDKQLHNLTSPNPQTQSKGFTNSEQVSTSS